MYSINTLRSLQQNVRSFSYSANAFAKNHYELLGITPKATQSEVKDAYYKLSMVYHPDKNIGNESTAQKFRDITEAYEILGNVRLRKLYDKGVSHIRINMPTDTSEDPTLKFYRSRERRTQTPSTGRSTVYNFDEWSRAHYGATFARDMERKRNINIHKSRAEKRIEELQKNRVIMAIVVVFGLLMYWTSRLQQNDITYSLGDTTISRKPPKLD